MTHPPKKKHQPRERSEVTRLTAAQQAAKAQALREKADMHLAEAREIFAKGIAPNAGVHSSYFAMELAAMAALLLSGGVGKYGDVPNSHAHIIEHFAKLTQ